MHGINPTVHAVAERQRIRFKVAAPVVFFWSGREGAMVRGEGITRDLSTSGVFIWSEMPPKLESQIEFQLTLPGFQENSPPIRLKGHGKVVRLETVEQHALKHGFAVASEEVTLYAQDEKIAFEDDDEGKTKAS